MYILLGRYCIDDGKKGGQVPVYVGYRADRGKWYIFLDYVYSCLIMIFSW